MGNTLLPWLDLLMRKSKATPTEKGSCLVSRSFHFWLFLKVSNNLTHTLIENVLAEAARAQDVGWWRLPGVYNDPCIEQFKWRFYSGALNLNSPCQSCLAPNLWPETARKSQKLVAQVVTRSVS